MMKKFLNILQIIVLVLFLSIMPCNKSNALGFLPPMPWDPVSDIPTDITKSLTSVQSQVAQVGSVKKLASAKNLKSIKGKLKSTVKSVLKGVLVAGIAAGGFWAANKMKKFPGTRELTNKNGQPLKNEEDIMTAVGETFFMLPEVDNVFQIGAMKSAREKKVVDFQQDTLMDAYLLSQSTEIFLAKMEQTLDVLEACHKGSIEGDWDETCKFFGVTMINTRDSASENSGGDENDEGQYGELVNSYIVAMVYDRVLTVVESLTAQEALLAASKQLKGATPINESTMLKGKSSSAEEYLPETFKFAYSETKEQLNANFLQKIESGINLNRNLETKNIMGDVDPDVLSRIEEVENLIEEARTLHNMAAGMGTYKTMKRQYFAAESLHNRAINAIIKQDDCIVTFLKSYRQGIDEDTIIKEWYGRKEKPSILKNVAAWKQGNINDSLGGISKSIMVRYNNIASNKISGITGDLGCGDYQYEDKASCADGYVAIEYKESNLDVETYNEACANKYACRVELIEAEVDGSNVEDADNSIKDTTDESVIDGMFNNADKTTGLKDPNSIEKMGEDSRIQTEIPWMIGRDAIMDLVKSGKLKFEPWNDQKSFQKEYLRNKYRNIRMIIETVDQGLAAFRMGLSEEMSGNLSDDIKIITSCPAPIDVVKNYKEEWQKKCPQYAFGGHLDSCNASANNEEGSLTIRGTYKVPNGKGGYNTQYSETTIFQKAGNGGECTIGGNAGVDLSANSATSNGCSSAFAWNGTIKTLKDIFFKCYLANDNNDEVQGFKNKAKSAGRIVAEDKLEEVLQTKAKSEAEIKNLIKKYNKEVEKQNEAVKNYRNMIKHYSNRLSELNKENNNIIQERKKTKERINDIERTIAELNRRKKVELNNATLNKASKERKNEIEESYNEQIRKLNSEKEYLTGKGKKVEKCFEEGREELYALQSDCISEKREKNVKEQIKSIKASIETYQKRINDILGEKNPYDDDNYNEPQGKLDELAQKFSKDYIEKVTEGNNAINEKNDEFEQMVEPKENSQTPIRMYKSKRTYTKDNLEYTISGVLNNHGEKDIKSDTLKKDIENVIASYLNTIFNNKFTGVYLAQQININGISLVGWQTKDTIIKVIKEMAAQKIAIMIKQKDKDVQETIDKAVAKVNNLMNLLGVNGENPTFVPSYDINDKASYDGGNGIIPSKHLNLINELEELEDKENGIDFGLPLNAVTVDSEYFVGLPARGVRENDINSGRDYLAPHEPLINLPPLREAFYYSIKDYDAVPQKKQSKKEKKKKIAKPSVFAMLMKKYEGTAVETEYLPEIWRYLLATPNLRDDGRYNYTFIERSFDINDELKVMLKEDKKMKEFSTILQRADIYPHKIKISSCGKTGEADSEGILDYGGRRMSYTGWTNLFKTDDTICRKDYNKMKSDSTPRYSDKSELGQFLDYYDDGSDTDVDVKYRAKFNDSYSQLLKTKEEPKKENKDIVFDHNLLGTYLNLLVSERNFKQLVDSYDKNINDALTMLCETFHQSGETTNGSGDITIKTNAAGFSEIYVQGNACGVSHWGNLPESNAENPNDVCTKEKINYACALEISKLLATSESDINYFYGTISTGKGKNKKKYETGSLSKLSNSGNNYSSYASLLARLNVLKNNKLERAKTAYNTLNRTVGGVQLVKEKLDTIKNYLDAFAKDSNAVAVIQPGATGASHEQETKTALANKQVQFLADEEAISAMLNQNHVAAYCPVYIYK